MIERERGGNQKRVRYRWPLHWRLEYRISGGPHLRLYPRPRKDQREGLDSWCACWPSVPGTKGWKRSGREVPVGTYLFRNQLGLGILWSKWGGQTISITPAREVLIVYQHEPTESRNTGFLLADNQSCDLNNELWLVVYLIRSFPVYQVHKNIMT